MGNSTEKKRSLALGLVIVIVASICVVNVVQNLIVVSSMRKAASADAENNYTEMAKAYAAAIENRVNGMFDSLDWYVNAKVTEHGSDDEIVDWLYQQNSKRNKDFSRVFYCEKDGKYFSDDGKSSNIADRSYFIDIMQKGQDSAIDDPVTSRSDGRSVVHVARAVKQDGRTVGFFCAVVDLTLFTDLINNIRVGNTGYAWMLASNGLVISHPNDSYIMKENFLTGLDGDHAQLAEAAQRITRGETGSGWVKPFGSDGKEFVTFLGIKGTPWGLAVSVSESEVFQLSTVVSRFIITGGVIGVLILLIISGLMLRRSLKPLKVVEDTITGIASGNADLTQRIEIDSNNEIGFVVKGFNKFTEKLQDIIKDVKESKGELSIAGEDMSAMAQDTASAIKQILVNIDDMGKQINGQASSVDQTAGAVNQIASNIRSLEQMIESQSSGVAEASAAVEEMIGNISSVNSSMDKMSASFEGLRGEAQTGINKQQDVNERIKKIEEQSAMLQEANSAISSIAEQTNLLAMNAAIEAAHAGEAGKGFSVVADEIRKLSETSTAQSKTIGDQLNGIKESIGTVVEASLGATKAFESFAQKIRETDELVIQIKAAMEEQNQGSKQISDSLHAMNDSTQDVLKASTEMSSGNQAILREVSMLQKAAGSMKSNMEDMAAGARKVDETGTTLGEISKKVKDSIDKIGAQIDLFKV